MQAMYEKMVILTGAGISAESGLGTFRDAQGLWAQHRIEDVATPEGFAHNPELVQAFYNARRAQAAEAQPNAAHAALAQLQSSYPGEVILVTQNVDALHEAAGSKSVLHMHGALASALCASCDHRWPAPPELSPDSLCPQCQSAAARPDVVWFGEMPYHMDRIFSDLETCDLFVAIGTSGQVYPAAGFVDAATAAGAQTIELNLEPSATHSRFDSARFGRASELIPTWVAELIEGPNRD
ncbi:MAG: NAD-dependent protein deacylase [Roseobacter sp. MedPE-SW]|nr:MAG: NAD-dependent protein deacylase [Roseobacter sp. MedPE-SW]